jgi:hypothetical protein
MAAVRKVRKTLLLVAKLGIAAALLAVLLRQGKLDPQKIGQALRETPFWLGLALLVYNVCILITAFRWRMLLRSQDLHPTAGDCVRMAYIGCFFSCFLPGGTGGDLVKAYYVARDSPKKAEAVTTVFLDRVLGLYCMVGLAAVAILFRLGYLWHYGGEKVLFGLTSAQLLVVGVEGGFVAATVGLAAFLSSHCRRLVHWLLGKLPAGPGSVLKRIYEAVYLYRSHPLVLVKFVLYSVANHTLASFALFLIGYSLSDPVAHGGARAFNYLFLIPLGLVLNGLPIAPAGVGVFEWALGFLFGTVLRADEPNVGATLAALAHILIILTNQIGLIFYLKGKRRVVEALHEAREETTQPPEPPPDASP